MSQQDFATAAAELARLDRLEVPDLEVLYRLERTSGRLYEELADRVDDEEAAAALRRNAREELGHARRVRRAITLRAGAGYQPPADLEEEYPVTAPPVVDAALLTAIVHGERAGDADYQRWAENEPDPDVAHLLRVSGREESAHADRLARAIARLAADHPPEPGARRAPEPTP